MLRSLNSGVSGIRQFQTRLDVIGNNIANSNTVGFKSSRTDFAEAFNQTLKASSSGANGSGVQVGTGVSTAAVRDLFTSGTISQTGGQNDLAINGEGFFIVRDPVSGEEFATRSGEFKRDAQNYLVTHEGFRLQGFSNSDLSTRGDIQIDDAGKPQEAKADAAFSGFKIDETGKVIVELTDKTQFARGQVLLQNFRDPQALVKEGNGLYSGLAAASPLGGASPQAQPPGSSGLGRIQSGALELSNVDLANEFAGLITTQRGFQASARIVTTSDEVLQEVVNLKR